MEGKELGNLSMEELNELEDMMQNSLSLLKAKQVLIYSTNSSLCLIFLYFIQNLIQIFDETIVTELHHTVSFSLQNYIITRLYLI